MILAYGGKNCWAFKEWMEIDFRVNKNVPNEISFDSIPVVPAMCFEGPNAAGKSCALRVLSFIFDFCLNSFSYSPDNPILVDTFFHNDGISQFYLEFCLDENYEEEYKYEVSLDVNHVISEKLSVKKGKERLILVNRKENTVKINKLSDEGVNIIYKSNASIISTMIQYGIEAIKPFKSFFTNMISNVSYSGTYENPLSDFAAKYYYEHPELHKRVVNQLRLFDTGIKDVEIVPFNDDQGKNLYFSVFHHDTDTDSNRLPFISQSTGTKLLYNRLREFYLILDKGGILIFDEIDNHLHSDIIPILVDFFLDEKENKKKAQIVFTSHNTMLLDLLKKYRVYLFNKIKGESICYRIDEIPGNNNRRNDRSLEQLYRAGMLGGVPNAQKE